MPLAIETENIATIKDEVLEGHRHHHHLQYCGVIMWKMPEFFLQQTKLFLHHDNLRPHTVFIIQYILAKNKITVFPHPSYSANLALWTFSCL